MYGLFKCNYTIGKRTARIPLLFNAIGYLTNTVSFKNPVRNDYQMFIQVQSNVNKMFGSKKKNEIKNKTTLIEKAPKKENINIEIVQDKIGIFNEIDQIITG